MADRFWVGGAGTWNNNSGGRWSNVSGGGGGWGNPGSTDNAIFDANSGSGSYQVTISAGRSCYNLITTGFTGRLQGGATTDFYIYGTAITLGNYGTHFPTIGPRLFLYTYAGCTITCNGQSMPSMYIPSSASASMADDLITHNNSILNIQGGVFDANDRNISIGLLSMGSGTLYMRSGTWNVMQAGPLNSIETPWNYTGGTIIPGTSTLRFNRAKDASGLYSGINSNAGAITLVDAVLDGAGNLWPTSGTIEIEREQITYTGLSYSNGWQIVTLTGCTRGVNGTTATSHYVSGTAVLLYGIPVTYLTSLAGSSDSTLNVNNTTNFPNDGNLLIDGEIITYTGKTSTTFTGCSRGQYNGTYTSGGAASHASGTVVRQVEGRNVYFGGFTYNIVEFDNNGCYMVSNTSGSATISKLTSSSTANTAGVQLLKFGTTPTVTTNQLQGQLGSQGAPAQPIYVYNYGSSSLNSTKAIYLSSAYPSLPYTYEGDGWDFFDFLLQSVGPTFETKTITYSLGTYGSRGYNNGNGGNGGTTTVTFSGTTITAYGGTGGYYNTGQTASGGGYSGGDGGSNGGSGAGVSGDQGGGGGGGICGNNGSGGGCAGGTGGNMGDISGLQTALAAAGGSVGYAGSAGDCSSSGGSQFPGATTGYGAGGSGSGYYGGDGASGTWGGGGAGGAGYSGAQYGGYGGDGFIVVSINNGATCVVLTSGSSYTIPSNATTVKVWAIGGGGGGAGSEAPDGCSGGGGGAGGTVYKTWTL